jgi:hypothetical protein
MANLAALFSKWTFDADQSHEFQEQFKKFWFFVAKRQIDKYWDCSKHNYLYALTKLNGLYLKPWESYRINDSLAWLTWYCMWVNPWKYQFYQWVCGASTQLYRVSLLMPDIEITKRFPHSQRYVKYYDEIVYWDDAAIYEFQKTFAIKNNWQYPVYFKILDRWDTQYLVWVTPTKPDKITKIDKRQVAKLKGSVSKTVFSLTWNNKLYEQNWLSNYSFKSYDSN